MVKCVVLVGCWVERCMCVFSVIVFLWLVSSGLMLSLVSLGILVSSCDMVISIWVMLLRLVVGLLW